MNDFKQYIEDENEFARNLSPLDETEQIHIDLTDDLLSKSKIAAYSIGQMVDVPGEKKDIPYNPKKFPDKAIQLKIPVCPTLDIYIFLDTKEKKWDSSFNYNGQQCRLSPDQMGAFFSSNTYQQMSDRLSHVWPTSDPMYSRLYDAVLKKEMLIDSAPTISEDNSSGRNMTNLERQRRLRMKNKDVDNDGSRDYTSSGRRIVHFGDSQVSTDKTMCYCWPSEKKIFKATSWAEWKKIKPLCRLRFKHGEYMYGLSLSTLNKDYDLRGFRAYNLTLEPKLQWLTKEETKEVMQLSVVKKFLKGCVARITKYVEMDPNEIYKNIKNKHDITVHDIETTQEFIRRTMIYVIKRSQIDSFKWSK